MFDVDFKERAELLKKQAKQKTKLGPIGEESQSPEIIPSTNLMSPDDNWVMTFRLFANVREAYGVIAEKGKWKIIDEEKFKKVDAVKRKKLRPFWSKPL